MKCVKILFILLICVCNFAVAQTELVPAYLGTMQFSPDVHWRQTEYKKLKVFFPSEQLHNATRVIETYKFFVDALNADMQADLKPITLVLNNKAADPNGYVALAPRKSEWITIPMMDPMMGANDWIVDLLIHEYRHVVQIDKVDKDLSWGLKLLMGEQGQAIANIISTPRWSAEGDAVVIETVLSKGGRGRYPHFDRHYRALLLDSKLNSKFEQYLLGSYKRYYPNHYVFGYMFLSYLRHKYGEDILTRIYNITRTKIYNLHTFYTTLEEITGVESEKLYQAALAWHKKRFSKLSADGNLYQVRKREDFGLCEYPQFVEEVGFICLKLDLDKPFRFVKMSDGEELFFPSLIYGSRKFHVRGRFLTYTQKKIHHRYNNHEFANICVYDVKQREHLACSSGKKLYHPSFISKQEVVAVQAKDDGTYDLVSWNYESNSFKTVRKFPFGFTPSSPIQAGEKIAYILKNSKGEKAIFIAGKKITPYLYNDLGNLVYHRGRIFFDGHLKGKMDVFSIGTDGKNLYQWGDDKIAAFMPTIHNKKVHFNVYRSNGEHFVSRNFSPVRSVSFDIKSDPTVEASAKKNMKFDYRLWENKISKPITPVQHQKLSDNPINPHSWLLLAPPLSGSINLEAYSTNLLNTVAMNAGYAYGLIEKNSTYYAAIEYAGLYPIFGIEVEHKNRKSYLNPDAEADDLILQDEWKETEVLANMRFESSQLFGNQFMNFSFGIGAGFFKMSEKVTALYYEPSDERMKLRGAQLSFSLTDAMAARDLYPRRSIELKLSSYHAQGSEDEDFTGRLNGVYLRTYFPGLSKHHHLFFDLSHERQKKFTDYRFESEFLQSRGYDYYYSEKVTRLSANYSFPIAYPDATWGDWFYFKQLIVNPFYDYQKGEVIDIESYQRSAGIELISEFHFLRLEFPFQVGLRYSNLVDNNQDDSDFAVFIQTGYEVL